jgi:hypothetical protein
VGDSIWTDREVAVRFRAFDRAGRCARSLACTLATLATGLAGCGAVKQDVYQYYRQMAQNYHEAGEKAKFDAITVNAESRGYLQAGDVHKYNRARKELSRIKDWEARCEAQRQRFERAARDLEPSLPHGKAVAPQAEAASNDPATTGPG